MGEALAAALRPSNPRHPVPPRDPASPKGMNAMGVLAHHPELTNAYNQLIRHALYFTTLTPRQRELLVLRVAHLPRGDVRVGAARLPGRRGGPLSGRSGAGA